MNVCVLCLRLKQVRMFFTSVCLWAHQNGDLSHFSGGWRMWCAIELAVFLRGTVGGQQQDSISHMQENLFTTNRINHPLPPNTTTFPTNYSSFGMYNCCGCISCGRVTYYGHKWPVSAYICVSQASQIWYSCEPSVVDKIASALSCRFVSFGHGHGCACGAWCDPCCMIVLCVCVWYIFAHYMTWESQL